MSRTLLPILCIAALVGCTQSPAQKQGADVALSSPATRPATVPATQQVRSRTIDQAIADGVAFLVKSQNEDGSWGTGTETRGFEVYSMVPGSHDAFRVATTALCVMALREAGETEAHGRGVDYLVKYGQARRDDADKIYNVWAHTYALQALAGEIKRGKGDQQMREAALWHLERLARYETYVGGWNYYDFRIGTQRPAMEPTSFGTAAGLVALHEARSAGIEVSQPMIDRALRRLADMRLPNGAYLYGSDYKYIPRMSANLPRGSVGRTQSANYALWLWKHPRVREAEVLSGLEMFEKERPYMNMGRKRPYPHESWYQTAAYYYYFGHYYTGRILEDLGQPARRRHGAMVAGGILPYQEPDGSWWDYAMWDYHKPYGTAFAVMTLLRCE